MGRHTGLCLSSPGIAAGGVLLLKCFYSLLCCMYRRQSVWHNGQQTKQRKPKSRMQRWRSAHRRSQQKRGAMRAVLLRGQKRPLISMTAAGKFRTSMALGCCCSISRPALYHAVFRTIQASEIFGALWSIIQWCQLVRSTMAADL